jgi:aminopeptidase N
LDKLLLKAYNRGAILCGVSAGAICWFEKGITDSWASNLNVMDCMGFVDGCCCPHYDGEKDRRPSVEKFLKEEQINSCYALDDGAALHLKGGKIHTGVTFYEGASVWNVSMQDEVLHHKKMKSIVL